MTLLRAALRQAGVETGLVRVRRCASARLEASHDGVAGERGDEAVVEVVAHRGRRAVALTWSEAALPPPTVVAGRVRAALAATPDLPAAALRLDRGPMRPRAHPGNFDALCRRWRAVLRQALAVSPGIVARVELQLKRVETETTDLDGRTAWTTRQEAAIEVAARARPGGRIAAMLAATLPRATPRDLAPLVRRAIRQARARSPRSAGGAC